MKRHQGSRTARCTQKAPSAGARIQPEALESRVLFATTSDAMYPSQYALANTAVDMAWETTRGSAAVVVASIDSGVDYTHPDLYSNVWINQAEIPATLRQALLDTDGDGRISFYDLNDPANHGRTTDVNGNGYIDAGDLLNPAGAGGWEDGVNGRSSPKDRYVDDIVGWDFAEDDNDPFDGAPNGGHGTHTAGVIGAVGDNGVGISGVAQKVSMMIVRVFDDAGVGASAARVAESIRYSADGGALAANASWGSPAGRRGDEIYRAIAYAGSRGQVFVAAAGNGGRNIDSAAYGNYPAEYRLPNIIAVGATTPERGLGAYSNYGKNTVDVVAPGTGVLSTLPGNRYAALTGTSMAAPVVTGAVALMLSTDRSLTPGQIKQRLVAGADDSVALSRRSVSGGELNVGNAVSNRPGARRAAAASTPTTFSLAEATGMSLTKASRFSARRIRPSDAIA